MSEVNTGGVEQEMSANQYSVEDFMSAYRRLLERDGPITENLITHELERTDYSYIETDNGFLIINDGPRVKRAKCYIGDKVVAGHEAKR